MLDSTPVPDPSGLRLTVSPALADYRIWRHHVIPGEEFDAPVPVIRNAVPRWFIPRTADLAAQPLNDALTRDGHWHLQIHVAAEPRYYARVRRVRERWLVEWFGEQWLAADVHRGLAFLEERAAGLEGELRMVSSSLYEFTSFWLPARDEHVVVSASPRLERLPLLTFIGSARLGQALLSEFGANHGAGGLV